MQRHWKKAFFWVAVAGVGYLTVPELYYDRFYRCAGVDDPDYEGCISVLSYAALEEEDQMVGRVRAPMPSTAAYRYTAKVEPTQEAKQTCSFEPFVERQWNQSFVWVQIPQTGNVTVPEDYYDRFYGKVGGEPPNYAGRLQGAGGGRRGRHRRHHRPRSRPQIVTAPASPREPGSVSRALCIGAAALPRGVPGPIAMAPTGSPVAASPIAVAVARCGPLLPARSIGRTCCSGFCSQC